MLPRHGSAFLLFLLLLSGQTEAYAASNTTRVDQPFGYVEVDPDDLLAAVEEGAAARSAAREVLAIPNVKFDIVGTKATGMKWGDLSSDGTPIYVWRFRSEGDLDQARPPNYVLRHEIGHDLFVRYLVPSTKKDQYGGDAPDWLDEMAAVAFEGCAQAKSRRSEAGRFARAGTLIPLSRFLLMPHPELSSRPPSGSRANIFGVALASSAETPQFYAMARAFYDLLLVRTKSTAVVADLAAAFRRGEPLEQWILSRVLKRKPERTIDLLDHEFIAWIAEDTRYHVGQIEDHDNRKTVDILFRD